VRQSLVAVILVCAVYGATSITSTLRVVPALDVTVVLALAAVAVGVMCAVLAALIGRLISDERVVWIGVALALYSVVAIPAATVGMTVDRGVTVIGNVRLGAHVCVVLLLLIAAFWPRLRDRCGGGRRALLSAVVLCALCAGLGLVFPSASIAVTTAQPVRIVVALGAVVAGASLAVLGWRPYSPAHSWIGLGCAVIGLAHLGRVVLSGEVMSPQLSFLVLRLLGLGVVLLGLGVLALWALRSIDGAQVDQEELRSELHRTAEQRHELRNGLAGLAGAADLLEAGGDESDVLRAAVAAEVGRLEELLRRPGGRPPRLRGEYSVEDVLRQQTVIRRSGGMDVRFDSEPDLCAVGTPHTLAQVLTNVLANCAAHAADSPVRIQASRRGGSVVVRVTDFGPGVEGGSEAAVFEAGERRRGSPGQGLGLHISRRLLSAEGGAIEIRSAHGCPGCTVLIHLAGAGSAAAVSEGALSHGSGRVMRTAQVAPPQRSGLESPVEVPSV
jgi:two-component system OmpR family sensor kinase